MIMPKRKQGIKQLLMPVFAAAIITVPVVTGFAVGATSPANISKTFSQSKDDRSSTKDRDGQTSGSNASKSNKNQISEKQSLQPQEQTNTVDLPATPAKQTIATKTTMPSIVVAASKTVNEAPTTVDTSAATAQLAVSQSIKMTQPIEYQTAKISTDQRNELLQISMFIAAASASLYALSYAGVLWRLFYGEPVAARRTITQ